MKTLNDMKIGALMRTNFQELSKIINERIIKAGFDDIRTTHLPATQLLYYNPLGLTATELAEITGMTKQAMGELVRHLEKSGYIKRERKETDQRVLIIRLTKKGEDMMEHLDHIASTIETDLADKLGNERLQSIRQNLIELLPIIKELN